jgi:hypothetical protein
VIRQPVQIGKQRTAAGIAVVGILRQQRRDDLGQARR